MRELYPFNCLFLAWHRKVLALILPSLVATFITLPCIEYRALFKIVCY